MIYNYRTLLRKEPEGGYTVFIPSLPGCISYGETMEESIKNIKEAVELYIETKNELGEEIPTEEETFEYNIKVEV
ncbi:MAG TPA: type II toxin-antitoxin system HicB family antitoxin [Ignavibacteria bacterium]|nr:type II toxin-antitoxin system HicB family antitoxin [Ignavibacteria bacterium]